MIPNKKELEASVKATQQSHPFKKCSCGRAVPESAEYCLECERLYNLGMAVKPTVVKDVSPAVTHKQAINNHSGYSSKGGK